MSEFSHTHIKNFDSAKWIIDLSINKKCPFNIPKYFLISLIRINNDEMYLIRLKEILSKKNTRKVKYINRSR